MSDMRINYLLELFGNLSLSLYCGGLLYQGFVARPSRLVLDKKNSLRSLNKALEICVFYLPIMLLPGIIIPIVRYTRYGSVLYLVGGVLASLIFPITLIFLIGDYNKIKVWANDDNFEYEKEREQVDKSLKKIKYLHFLKAFLSFVALILFIVGSNEELNEAIKQGKIKDI